MHSIEVDLTEDGVKQVTVLNTLADLMIQILLFDAVEEQILLLFFISE